MAAEQGCCQLFKTVRFLIFIWSLLARTYKCEDMCWSTFGNYQFRVYPSEGGKVFEEAISLCESVNTTLTSIHSEEEDSFLEDFVMTQMSVPLWIGLRRHDDTLTWVDGTEVDYVYPKYRRKTFTDSCIYMFQGWIDSSCQGAELYFICKREVTGDGSCLTTTEEPPTTTTEYVTTTTAQTTSTSTTTIPTKPTTTTTTRSPKTRTTSRRVTPTAKSEQTAKTTLQNTEPDLATTKDGEESTGAEKTTTTSTEALTATSADLSTDTTERITTTEREITFEELIDEMTVKEKPVYATREGENSKAIGSVSWLILLGFILGVVLMDMTTMKRHATMLKKNIRGVCRRHKNSTVDLRMIDMDINGKRF